MILSTIEYLRRFSKVRFFVIEKKLSNEEIQKKDYVSIE